MAENICSGELIHINGLIRGGRLPLDHVHQQQGLQVAQPVPTRNTHFFLPLSSRFAFRIFPKILYDITGTALHGTGLNILYFNVQSRGS